MTVQSDTLTQRHYTFEDIYAAGVQKRAVKQAHGERTLPVPVTLTPRGYDRELHPSHIVLCDTLWPRKVLYIPVGDFSPKKEQKNTHSFVNCPAVCQLSLFVLV